MAGPNYIGVPLILVLSLSACEGPSPDQARQGDTAGPVGWWTFDEGAGDTAADASGNGNTAAIRNGGWGEGRIGGALQMDGGDDAIVTVPLSESLRSTREAITVMGWAYRTAEHNVALVGHGYPALFLGFHGPQFKWLVTNERNKRARCYADPKYRAGLDRWYHLAGTYDGATARLYVDGVEICKDRLWRGAPLQMPDAPFSVSGYLGPDGAIVDEITGRIDDVRIYDRALGADEIRAVFEAGG